ncbi:uncharacterized protein K02A2.6-like [Saccostrea cucullata]|uniref:uncharacterized protein K02A2.6-like n=1 Tax=Saccostrea cuccullata TaxID=36930 RepID=UPI002ED1906C
MAHIGKLGEFSDGKETFVNYVERMEQYFEANEVKNEKRVAVFLSVVGPSTYGALKNLLQPALPKEKSFKDIVKTLTDYYMPKPLVISERFKFNKRNQREGETVNEYVCELKNLSKYCEFKDFLKEALRDRLVCGLKYEAIQKKLLSEADLTFEKAIRIATAMETAEKDTLSFTGNSTPVHYVKSKPNHWRDRKGKNPKPMVTVRQCFRCGGKHDADTCKFKNTKCFKCDKIGHLAKKCRHERGNPKFNGKPTLYVNEDSKFDHSEEYHHEEHSIYSVFNMETSGKTKDYSVDLELGDKLVKFQIDTGSARTIVNESVYRNRLSEFNLKKSSASLKSYTKEEIPILGEFEVTAKYGEQCVPQMLLLVVKGNQPCLLGRDWLSKIRLNWENIFSVTSGSVDTLLKEYEDLFKENSDPIKNFKAQIRIKEHCQPIFCKARPVPYALKEKVEAELKKLEERGVIYPVKTSEWAAPIVVVPKPDKSVRLCGDYKVTVNRVISEEQYPLPNTDDMFATLAGGQKFTKLDLRQAYSQLELSSDSEEYLTVNTHLGLYRYRRLAYGVSSASAIFQGVMDKILSGLPYVVCRIDDILITAPDDDSHVKTIQEVFRRLREHNITLRKDKCIFMADQVIYMGFLVDKQGIHPTDEKIAAIRDAPRPKDVKEVKAYLGLLNYYGAFLPNLSTVLQPLHQLLKKGENWSWTDKCEESFENSKQMITKGKLLVFYDMNKPLRLACDSSSYGLGAVVSHIMEDGSERPVAFASRTLNSSERNYAQVEKEALSIIFGVKKFHKYLYGRTFTLITDHKPLVTIFGPKNGVPTLAAAIMQRWALILSGYQYQIQYRASQEHGNCDSLSRPPISDNQAQEDYEDVYFSELDDVELLISNTDIAKATKMDPVLSKVHELTLTGWPNHNADPELQPFFERRISLSVEQGVVLWGIRVVIPKTLRKRILEELHVEHLGMCRMKSLARGYLWWPNLDKDIEEVVEKCPSCTCISVRNSPKSAPLHPWIWATRPFQRIHIDYADYKGQSLLIVYDSYSKWIDAIPVRSMTSLMTIDKLRMLFASTGLPEEIVSDNRTQFTSSEFKEFARLNGIKHTLVPPYHPQSNGFAERGVQIVKKALKCKEVDGKPHSLEHKLADLLLKYRITPHTTTGVAPAELFLKRQLRSRLSLIKPDNGKRVENFQQKMKQNHERGVFKV